MSWFIPTSHSLGLAAQNKLLAHFMKSNYESKHSNNLLNYIEIKSRTKNNSLNNIEKEEKTLILMHGFGLGLGFFFANYDQLAPHFDRIIAVDWLGMGCSSRNNSFINKYSLSSQLYSTLNNNKDEDKILNKAAVNVSDTFIDSLEEFRSEMKISKFVLAGHSLGGFLAAKYAIKYPKHVDSLVLISPVGLPDHPPKESHLDPSNLDWRIRVFHNLWKFNVTPQNVVKLFGPKGPDLVTTVLNRRFSRRWNEPELKVISDYLYHISALPGSGEYALNALLKVIYVKHSSINLSTTIKVKSSGVYAREPLDKEFHSLKVPLLVLFGDTDWLYYPSIHNDIKKWREASGMNMKLKIISKAGHHLYLDNANEFNNEVIDWVSNNNK